MVPPPTTPWRVCRRPRDRQKGGDHGHQHPSRRRRADPGRLAELGCIGVLAAGGGNSWQVRKKPDFCPKPGFSGDASTFV